MTGCNFKITFFNVAISIFRMQNMNSCNGIHRNTWVRCNDLKQDLQYRNALQAA